MSAPDEEQVRRLLAAARVETPVPDDVAARLDDVLAGLVAQRAASSTGSQDPSGRRPGEATVTSLTRRRRRRAATWAVAAASVAVVAGAATGQLGTGTPMSGDDAAGSSEAFSRSAPEEQDAAPGTAREGPDGKPGAAADGAPGAAQSLTSSRALRTIGTETFEADVIALRALGADPAARRALLDRDCLPVDTPDRASLFRVTYDGEPAALVLHPVSGGRQLAELLPCGGDGPARTALLPAP